jgi:hypothetical protein
MKNKFYTAIKLVISFIISGSVLFAGTSVIRYFDPTFSISLFDLLSQTNFTAWLLLALLAGIIFGVLSLLPVFTTAKPSGNKKTNGKHQQSD